MNVEVYPGRACILLCYGLGRKHEMNTEICTHPLLLLIKGLTNMSPHGATKAEANYAEIMNPEIGIFRVRHGW